MVRLQISKNTESTVLRYESKNIPEGAVIVYGTSDYAALTPAASLPVFNRSLAECRMEELLFFYSRLVRPCKPSVLVVGGFLNDYFSHVSVAETMFLLNRLLAYARTDNPGIRLLLTDLEPCIKYASESFAWSRFKRYRQALHAELVQYCTAHPDTELLCFASSAHFFRGAEACGDPDKMDTALFCEDGLHLNATGTEHFSAFLSERLCREGINYV